MLQIIKNNIKKQNIETIGILFSFKILKIVLNFNLQLIWGKKKFKKVLYYF